MLDETRVHGKRVGVPPAARVQPSPGVQAFGAGEGFGSDRSLEHTSFLQHGDRHARGGSPAVCRAHGSVDVRPVYLDLYALGPGRRSLDPVQVAGIFADCGNVCGRDRLLVCGVSAGPPGRIASLREPARRAPGPTPAEESCPAGFVCSRITRSARLRAKNSSRAADVPGGVSLPRR